MIGAAELRTRPVRTDAAHALLVFAAAFATYLWSMPRTVVLEDDGLFITSAYFNAIAHPPGYPLYVALAHLATLAPLGTVAARVHAFTALLGALDCVVVWVIARRLLGRAAYAHVCALCLGFCEIFWSQSIIAEVYTLNVLFFAALLALPLLGVFDRPVRPGWTAAGTGLLCGLSLSNHWPLMVLSAPALAVLYWPYRGLFLRHAVPLALGALFGLLPYAWLVWRTHVVPEFCLIGPIRNWQEFWYYVSRAAYRKLDFNPGAGLWDKLQFAAYALREAAMQFGPAGVLPLFAGLVVQWRHWPARLCWALLLAFAGSTFLLIAIRSVDFDLFHRNTFRVYPLIPYLAAALWTALGAKFLVVCARRTLRAGRAARLLRAGLVLVLVGGTWGRGAPLNYRANDEWAAVYAAALLESLPPGATFFANADAINFPMGYLHWVEGMRRDVTFYTGWYLQLGAQAYRLYLLPAARVRSVIARFIREQPGDIYYTNEFPHDFGEEDYGLYMKVRRGTAAGDDIAVANPVVVSYLDLVMRQPPPRDAWEGMHYWWLRSDHCRLWANLNAASLPERLRSGAFEPCDHYAGRLLLARIMLASASPDYGQIENLLMQARALIAQATTKQDASDLSLLQGDVLLRLGRREEARRRFEESVAVWPHPGNPAIARLSAMTDRGAGR